MSALMSDQIRGSEAEPWLTRPRSSGGPGSVTALSVTTATGLPQQPWEEEEEEEGRRPNAFKPSSAIFGSFQGCKRARVALFLGL